jgi:hypothetical protein
MRCQEPHIRKRIENDHLSVLSYLQETFVIQPNLENILSVHCKKAVCCQPSALTSTGHRD